MKGVRAVAGALLLLWALSPQAFAQQAMEFRFSPGTGQRGQILSISGWNCRVGNGPPAEKASVYLYLRAGQPGVPFGRHFDFSVDSDASWSGELRIPADAPPGEYVIVVNCVEDDAVAPKGDREFDVRVGDAPTLTAPPASVTAGATLHARLAGCRTLDGVMETASFSIVPAAGGAAVAEATASVDSGAVADKQLAVPASSRGAHLLEGRCARGETVLAADSQPVEITAPPPLPSNGAVRAPTTTTTPSPSTSTSSPASSTTTTIAEVEQAGQKSDPSREQGSPSLFLPAAAGLLLTATGSAAVLVRRRRRV